ncbi:dihydrodipicolinate synthetase [Alcaligenes sp. HPC1271]|nr:dihydrodipicolinate synthase family protein [Alcaligenes sp. HPC1271]EKU28548.1 dihydrodipicolinate synthetase [Alcaligenes sp. HPC1271]
MKNKGVFSICPTPFKPGGELDLQSLVSLVNFQLEAGIHGLAILGVMGELHKLSTFERRRVIETVVAAVRGAVPVVGGGAGHGNGGGGGAGSQR